MYQDFKISIQYLLKSLPLIYYQVYVVEIIVNQNSLTIFRTFHKFATSLLQSDMMYICLYVCGLITQKRLNRLGSNS